MSIHPLPVGARVRHYGQQYPAARTGTATIVQVKGPWPDGSYEYEVATGKDFSRPTSETNPATDLRWWSSFTTIPAEAAPCCDLPSAAPCDLDDCPGTRKETHDA